MRIYFAGSIRGGRGDADLYRSLILHLKKYGEVLSEHIGEASLSASGEGDRDDSRIHRRDMEWLLSADVVIAEVTTPSLGVGYEIGRAAETGKPLLCLYRSGSERPLSAMIAGSPEVALVHYTSLPEAKKAIDDYFGKFFPASAEEINPATVK